MASGFSALMARMNYITRWGLMRNSRSETLSEHATHTACISHLLACAAVELYGAEDVRPDMVVCCALYHDASEILTGDMPTPVKYANSGIRDEYHKIERDAEQSLVGMLPSELQRSVGPAITGEGLTEHERKIIKSADKLSALVKCIEEEASGNTEFESAKRSTIAALEKYPLPEVEYFMREFLPAYSLTLDELLGRE